MNSQLDLYKVAEALVMLLEQFGIVVTDASVDIVPYLKTLGDKIVAYKEQTAWLWIIVGIVVAVLTIIIWIIGSVQDWSGGQWIVLLCGLFTAAIIIINNAHTIIACNTFPEKVILDYIDTIMQTNTTR